MRALIATRLEARAVMIAFALVLAASPAFADDDKAQAVALFDEGLKEMKAGNFEKACASFKQSNELQADSGTRGSLARCYEKLDKVASAWKLWTDLATTAPKNLRADAAANAAKLEARLPKYKLIIKLAPGAPKVAITIDGVSVDATPDVAVPLDPGTYSLEANAAGYTGWKHKFLVVEGRTEDITIPVLTPTAVAVPPLPPNNEPEPMRETPRSKRRPIGFAMLGVGGALVVTGTIFGVVARGRYGDAKDLCGGDIDVCEPSQLQAAQDKVDTARSAGNISTVMYVAGGAALVTGIVLIVTAPKRQSHAVTVVPTLGADSAGVVVSGGF